MAKRLLITILAAAVMMLSSEGATASMLHVWNCALNEGKTPADVQKVSSDWFNAAKADAAWSEVASCPGSSLWGSVEIE